MGKGRGRGRREGKERGRGRREGKERGRGRRGGEEVRLKGQVALLLHGPDTKPPPVTVTYVVPTRHRHSVTVNTPTPWQCAPGGGPK